MIVVKGDKPDDTNTITEPGKVMPITSNIKGVASTFIRTLDPYSVSILQIQTNK
jgi:Alpha-L-arabinofuranosidase